MRLARVTGFAGGVLLAEGDLSAVEEAKDWTERGPTRRAEGGTVAIDARVGD